jgi:hypothetical protein
MVKKCLAFIGVLWLMVNLCGCFALVAGAAGGAGTAVWLSGKLTQEVNAPFEKAVQAVKSGLQSLKLEVTKETVESDVAQIMARYSDAKTIWVDVRRITAAGSKIEVRVGAVNPDKAAADKIIKAITRNL